MIDLDTSYTTRSGIPVTLILNSGRGAFSVLGYIGSSNAISRWDPSGIHEYRDSNMDLVTVRRNDDFEIGEPVLARYTIWGSEFRRYYAGTDHLGRPRVFLYGMTPWSTYDPAIVRKDLTDVVESVRRPTEAELGTRSKYE